MDYDFKDIDLLIVKYLENEATLEEKAELDAWIHISNKNTNYFIQMTKAWEYSEIYFVDKDYNNSKFKSLEKLIKKRKTRKIFYGLSTAVAVILLVFIVNFFANQSEMILLSDGTNDQKKEILLPDGSKVVLNRNSTLKYDKRFNKNRMIYLSGEAFFDVVNNPKRPFVVESSDFEIKVIGTSFLVTNYSDITIAEAVLESGEIQLTIQESGKEFLLQPDQMIIHDKVSNETKLESVNAHNFTDWINSSLLFENTPLKDVFMQLEKWYSLRIECGNNNVMNTPVSFSVDDETVDQILNTLQIVVPFKWEEKYCQEDETTIIIII